MNRRRFRTLACTPIGLAMVFGTAVAPAAGQTVFINEIPL